MIATRTDERQEIEQEIAATLAEASKLAMDAGQAPAATVVQWPDRRTPLLVDGKRGRRYRIIVVRAE